MNHKGYQCARCGAKGCKLWRDSYIMLNQVELLCAPCTAKEEGTDISDIDADGKHTLDYLPALRSDQIGNWLPAVPTEDGQSFWGYTSVPEAGCKWWRELPTLPNK